MLRPVVDFSAPSQRQRATLPIAAYRSFITSTIDNSQCVVLCGETGWSARRLHSTPHLSLLNHSLPRSGKSTQVPSFILEHNMRQGKPVKVYCTEVCLYTVEYLPTER